VRGALGTSSAPLGGAGAAPGASPANGFGYPLPVWYNTRRRRALHGEEGGGGGADGAEAADGSSGSSGVSGGGGGAGSGAGSGARAVPAALRAAWAALAPAAQRRVLRAALARAEEGMVGTPVLRGGATPVGTGDHRVRGRRLFVASGVNAPLPPNAPNATAPIGLARPPPRSARRADPRAPGVLPLPLLNASAMACEEGEDGGPGWACSPTRVSHAVCGSPGVFAFSAPTYVAVEG
jgi:hypothetical protein